MAAPVVEPVDVFEGGELHVLEPVPGSVGVDQLPLVEAVERLDHRVVVTGLFGFQRGVMVASRPQLGRPV